MLLYGKEEGRAGVQMVEEGEKRETVVAVVGGLEGERERESWGMEPGWRRE